MTDLERRALLGDKRAQEEAARRGIVLPCPFCGGEAMIEYDDIRPFEYSVFCGDCGVIPSTNEDKQVAISIWNTRPAPPIGRCRGCKNWNGIRCSNVNFLSGPFDYCSYFEPKESEENAVD